MVAVAAFCINGCTMAENDPSAVPPSPASAGEPARDIMVWDDLLSRPQPEPDHRIAYGEGGLQFSELWLPIVDGIPASGHPTVLMIHGGCWQTDIAERDIMNWIAGDLRDRGIAVWNIEYRGVDREGGGWPGTYEDVIAATDSLIENAQHYNLDIDHLVVMGHSAGGHLALWLAARQAAFFGQPLTTSQPLGIVAVISQGGLPDLEAGQRREGHACGTEAPRLMAGDDLGETSPAQMVPSPAPQYLVNGVRDRIAPPEYARDYREKLREYDYAPIEMITIPGEGHVELISPGTAAWERQVELIEEALGWR